MNKGQFFIDEEHPHLGGFIQGGDPATYFPDLWRWLVEKQDVRSVIDVGCGEGHALSMFRDLGCAVLGIEGVWQEDPSIIQHDYTQGPWLMDVHVEPADLIWCCEYVEHVEERYVPNFLETFKCGKLVLMTHAEPGQAGWHHVNTQLSSYWIGVLAAIGYSLDRDLTLEARRFAALNTDPHNHFVRSGLAFERYDLPAL